MPNNRLRAWVSAEGAQSPMLVTGVSQEQLQEAADELLDWAKQGELTSEADIVWCETEDATLAIAVVRDVLRKLVLAAVAPRRIVIIPQAEKLSAPAANALLKSLEDASAATRYVLLTQWRRRLLPTILSRCQHIHLTGEARRAVSADNSILGASVLSRLAQASSYSEEDLATLAEALMTEFYEQGPSPELRSALTRLRDYYRISSVRGNRKLAKDVLLASLPEDLA